MFDGLVRGLKPDERLLADFVAAGYDPSDRKLVYPIEVWTACLDAAWKHRFPTLERYPAWTEIARAFIQGYFDTTVGRLISVTFPFLSPRLFIDRTPSYVRTGLKDSRVALEWVGPDQAVLTMHGPHEGAAYVMCGVLDVSLRKVRVLPVLVPEIIGADTSRVRITWTSNRP